MGLFSRKTSAKPPGDPPDNLELHRALEKLARIPTRESREALYRVLTQGWLRVAVKEVPPGLLGGPHVLEKELQMTMLTSQDPGGSQMVLAFTDAVGVQKRSPGSPWIAVTSRSLLEYVLAWGYGGLVLNPEGPWASIPAGDIREILRGKG